MGRGLVLRPALVLLRQPWMLRTPARGRRAPDLLPRPLPAAATLAAPPRASGATLAGRHAGPARPPRLGPRGAAAAAAGTATLPVTVEGAGSEVLFFVHGWPDDESLWDRQVARFQQQYRCMRVTMPHFGGRAVAKKLQHKPGGYDFSEAADILAATIRATCPGEPVVLVLHDWGCVWGFFVQFKHPELVKAVVAMDVGPPSAFPAGLRNLHIAVGIGLAYQYWLLTAFLLGRAAGGSPLRGAADGMARLFARLVQRGLGRDLDLSSDRITADACYPYYHFQRHLGVRGEYVAAGTPDPSCPCLFLYGARKLVKFHADSWEQHLRGRTDCQVAALPTNHWLQLEKPEEVNRIMGEWLELTLRGGPAEGVGGEPVPRPRL